MRHNSNSSTDPPAAIAMIAPIFSFSLELLWGTADGGEKEVGGGGGSTREQALRGPPHKSEFPTKDELGNPWRDDGIEPLRWL